MSTTAHIPSSSTIGGPIPSVSSNFNVPKVIANVGPTGMGQLYSQPSSVSFTTRSPQLQDHTRLLKPTSATSTASFAAHVTPSASVISSPAASISNSRIDANRQFPVPLPRMPSFFDGHTVSLPPTGKPYIAPIESVVRKPTSIAQIHSTGHVTTGINSVQLKVSHNSPVSVAVVNMGVQLTKSEAESKNHQTKSSLPNSTCIFSVQNMLSNTQSSSSNSSSSNIVTSLSPRPSILRKRPDTLRKPISQPSFDDSQITTTNDLTGNIRADGLQSNSLTIQNSPKSENVITTLEGNTKAVENGSSHPSILSPAKIKREFSSPLSAQHVVAPAVNTISLSSVSHDAGASPRKKPRKQNVVATEDKFGSLPLKCQTYTR
ncbi:histone deacetylase complex subunit SAP130-A-like isoform X2 [Xenia sp. Carnegie-2017]|uniref:histone deacetylase complex subunit SAP130-A-like isoform X2 n=1 Tax=Xenia sp. Carnegie-2017 TaxID=2897299 RepID=UPI001F039282|nr:histone deacetylase complex subunit SAP130-A-like isoform X2 [Xenia sp. Carnegie-2017]